MHERVRQRLADLVCRALPFPRGFLGRAAIGLQRLAAANQASQLAAGFNFALDLQPALAALGQLLLRLAQAFNAHQLNGFGQADVEVAGHFDGLRLLLQGADASVDTGQTCSGSAGLIALEVGNGLVFCAAGSRAGRRLSFGYLLNALDFGLLGFFSGLVCGPLCRLIAVDFGQAAARDAVTLFLRCLFCGALSGFHLLGALCVSLDGVLDRLALLPLNAQRPGLQPNLLLQQAFLQPQRVDHWLVAGAVI